MAAIQPAEFKTAAKSIQLFNDRKTKRDALSELKRITTDQGHEIAEIDRALRKVEVETAVQAQT